MTDLFTLAELASYLQQDLDTATATLARELATTAVQDSCKQTLTAVTGDVVYLEVSPYANKVTLPQRPVSAVTSIYTVDDADGTTETLVPATEYRWPRGDEVICEHSWAESLLKVTYSHGSDSTTFLATAKRIALAVAARIVDNPSAVKSEAIDDYSHSLTTAEGSSLLTVPEMTELRAHYGAGASYSVAPQ